MIRFPSPCYAPDNGSGTYTLAEPGPVNGNTGDADPITANFEDFEDALTARLMADGTKTSTANQPMGGFRHTNVGTATARTMYAQAGQIGDSSLTYGGVAGGTADALTIAPSPAITAYAIGQKFQFKVSASANTGAATLNVNAVGAGAVTWPDGTALVAGDLPASGMVTVSVQATTPVFHLETQTRAAGTLPPTSTITSTDAGAGAGPTFALYRNSSTPAASDEIGEVKFDGEDSAGNTQTYARAFGSIVDPTSTSEDGRFNIETVIAGTNATRGYVGHGLVMGSASGGDQGAGTINAEALYEAGVRAKPWPLLGTLTASASASLAFTAVSTTLYAGYYIEYESIVPATNAADFWLRMSVDGGSNYLSTGTYNHARSGSNTTPAAISAGAVNATAILIAASLANTAASSLGGTGTVVSGGAAANATKHTWTVGYIDSGGLGNVVTGYSSQQSTSQVNAFQWLMSSGDITSGTIRVYGIPK